MKFLYQITAFWLIGVTSVAVQARDDHLVFDIDAFLERADVQQRLGNEVKFFFADQDAGPVLQKFEELQSNKKTNAFNKTDEEACQWALLSAMLSLKKAALNRGGNAVINIYSFYKKNEFRSQTQYQCGAGTFAAGVTMRGSPVVLK